MVTGDTLLYAIRRRFPWGNAIIFSFIMSYYAVIGLWEYLQNKVLS